MKIHPGVFGKSDLEDENKGVIQDTGMTKADVTINMESNTTTSSKLLLPGPNSDRAKLANSFLGQKVLATNSEKPFCQLTLLKKVKSVLCMIGIGICTLFYVGAIVFVSAKILMEDH